MEKLTLNSGQDLKNYKKILKKNYILFLLLGLFGVHRFYLKKYVSGFLCFVFSIFFIGFCIFFILRWWYPLYLLALHPEIIQKDIMIIAPLVFFSLLFVILPVCLIAAVLFIFELNIVKKSAEKATLKKYSTHDILKNFCSCVIMCGGKSSRMGQDKTLMEFGKFKDLTHFQFAKMNEIFKSVFISAKSQKFDPPLPVLTDEFSEFSPMGAIYSILKNFKNDKVFIIPCDMPFVEISTIYKLYENAENYDICVASDKFKQHNLCGFFDTSVAATALKFYKRNNHKIANLFSWVKFKALKFDNSTQFHNINDKSDYEKAVLLLKKEI